MDITVEDPSWHGVTVGDLDAGDAFVVNQLKTTPLASRVVYMVMHPHTRWERLREYQSTSKEVICVNLRNGKLTSYDRSHPVLPLCNGYGDNPDPVTLYPRGCFIS